MSCESTGTKDGTHCFLDGKCVHCHCPQSATTSALRELSDGQTYDTPCAVCSNPLDGHTHELSAERLAEIDAWLNSMSGVPAKLPVLATPMSNALQVCYDLRQQITALQSRESGWLIERQAGRNGPIYRVAVKACHSSGKSYVAARIVLASVTEHVFCTLTAPRELSDSQTYDTLCPTCGKPLDGHTHDPQELSAEEWREKHGTGYTHDDRVGYANYRITALQSRLQAAEKRIKDLEGE